MRPPEKADLTPEQIDGIAREIGEMARQGHPEKAWAWVRRIREARRIECTSAGCDALALIGGRYCQVHQDRLELLRGLA